MGDRGKVGNVNRLKRITMSYSKLSPERKKAISRNAAEYAKNNYRQIKISLAPDVADKFDSICAAENISRPELIKKMIELYGAQK